MSWIPGQKRETSMNTEYVVAKETSLFVQGCEDAFRQYDGLRAEDIQKARRRFSKEPFISLPTNRLYWVGFRHGLVARMLQASQH